MAAAPLATLFTGRVLDEFASGDCHAPHELAGLDAPRSSARGCVVGRCFWVGHAPLSAEEKERACRNACCMMPFGRRPFGRPATILDVVCEQRLRQQECVAVSMHAFHADCNVRVWRMRTCNAFVRMSVSKLECLFGRSGQCML